MTAGSDPRRRFDDKVVIVTGSGNGIGSAYAAAFAREGARVVVADIDGEAARAVAKELTDRAVAVIGITVDVGDEDSVAQMVADCIDQLGGVDILVNNAGLHMGQYNLCSTLPVDEWRRLLDVNLLGPVLCARYCRPSMAQRGGGVIVNQSSNSSFMGVGAYSVSKLALNGVTVSLAREFAADGIRVVGIAPGMVNSEANIKRLPLEMKERVLKAQLLQRPGLVEELIEPVLMLCSDGASFITGETIVVDGGMVGLR